jgi:hypothetical protein
LEALEIQIILRLGNHRHLIFGPIYSLLEYKPLGQWGWFWSPAPLKCPWRPTYPINLQTVASASLKRNLEIVSFRNKLSINSRKKSKAMRRVPYNARIYSFWILQKGFPLTSKICSQTKFLMQEDIRQCQWEGKILPFLQMNMLT